MFLGFIRNRKTIKQDPFSPVEKMLEQTWDLSRQFSVPENHYLEKPLKTFNRFFKKLNVVMTRILQNIVKLAALAPDLFHFSKAFKQKASEQENRVTGISTAARTMAERIEKITANSQNVSADTSLIEAEVKEALTLGQNSMTRFGSIQSHVKDLSATIAVLRDNSKTIGSIIDVINNISDETNILSLNARIEAAKSDISGKGFKVIAEEISTLAKQSKTATNDIQEQLTVLSDKIFETVNGIQKVEEDVQAGEKMIISANKALGGVHDHIFHLSKNMTSIKQSIESQNGDVQKITDDITQIEDSVKTQTGEVEKIIAVADMINNICDNTILDTGIFHLSGHQKAKAVAESLASDPRIHSSDRNNRERRLKQNITDHDFIELSYITDESGRQATHNIYSSKVPNRDLLEKGLDKDWSKTQWFTVPRETRSTFISKIYRSSATKEFCFTVSVPLFSDHTFTGVIGIDINFKDMLNI